MTCKLHAHQTPSYRIYRSEPYGPFGPEEVQLLAKLVDEWGVEIKFLPGSTMQLLFRRKASR